MEKKKVERVQPQLAHATVESVQGLVAAVV
jgi:hypothetical protein